mgnify:CR=1 FL=1
MLNLFQFLIGRLHTGQEVSDMSKRVFGFNSL